VIGPIMSSSSSNGIVESDSAVHICGSGFASGGGGSGVGGQGGRNLSRLESQGASCGCLGASGVL
jgi:hypothetical protein